MTAILSLAISMAMFTSMGVPAVDDDGAQTAPPAANAPAKVVEPAVVEGEHPADIDPKVAALLDKLENAAADLHDFQANLRYDKWDPVTNRWEIRAGELLYEVDSASNKKRFAMNFDTLIVGNSKKDRVRRYVYSDGWLAEIDDEKKQFIKRQIVPPGKEFDPFRLGEGQFPLPIGQSRKDVLARFDVTLIDKPEAKQLADLENVEGMRLVPKPGMPEAETFARVDVFYDKATLLPVGIDVTEVGDDMGQEKKVVRLRDVKRNQGIDDAKLSVKEPNENDGWAVAIEPWRNKE